MNLRVARADLGDAAQAEAVLELIDCYARDPMPALSGPCCSPKMLGSA